MGKTWKPLEALYPFTGGTRKSVLLQFAILRRKIDLRGKIFLDGFSGSGAVSLVAKKMGCQVLSNDLMPMSYVTAQALIEREERIRTLNHLLKETDYRGVTEVAGEYYVDTSLFDRLMGNAKRPIEKHFAVKVMLESLPSQYLVKNPKTQRRVNLERTMHKVNSAVFSNGHKNRAFQGDARDFFASHDGDIASMDPPTYEHSAYPDTYGWINKLLGKTIEVEEIPLKKLWKEILDSADHIPIWFIRHEEAEIPLKWLIMEIEKRGRTAKKYLINEHRKNNPIIVVARK